MELQLKITGILLMVLAISHIVFPKVFKWKVELQGVSLMTRQLIHIHTLFIALTVFLMGLLCACCAADLLITGLGKKLLFGLCVFWVIRLYIQFFGYSKKLWKGKKFETAIHIVFSFLWMYVTAVFFVAFYSNKSW